MTSKAQKGAAEAKNIEKPTKKRAALRTKKSALPKTPSKKEVASVVIETKSPTETPIQAPSGEGGRYWEAIGRRKTATARVRLFTRGERGIWVNDKPHGMYFQHPRIAGIPEDPLKKMKSSDRFRVTAKISGGGIHAQAEALRHGISRALVEFNPDFRKRLKRAGFLTRDPRMKERKKFGLKGARRAPQWAKR